jgi:hypothetical protein
VDDFVVDRRGRGLLKPQSPRASDDCGVVIEARIGCGKVAESDVKMAEEDCCSIGRGKGGGIANTLEARRRAPPGDTLRVAIGVAIVASSGRARNYAQLLKLQQSGQGWLRSSCGMIELLSRVLR